MNAAPRQKRPFATATIDGKQLEVLPLETMPTSIRRALETTDPHLWPTLRAVQCALTADQQRSRLQPFYVCSCHPGGETEAIPTKALPQGFLDFLLKLPPRHCEQAVGVLARPDEARLFVTFATLYDILARKVGDSGFNAGLIPFGEKLSREEREARLNMQDQLVGAMQTTAEMFIHLVRALQHELAWRIILSEFPPAWRPKERQLPAKRQTSLTRLTPRPAAVNPPGSKKTLQEARTRDDAAPAALPASAREQIDSEAGRAAAAGFRAQPDEEAADASAA